MKKIFKNMMIIIVCVLLLIISISLLLNKVNSSDEIPDNYIAVFHGDAGETTYETYIYKIDNNQNNFGFEYINVTSTKEYFGSNNWKSKITSKGTFDWTDGAFTVAQKNKAYSYVTLPKRSNTTYTIEQFQTMFLMN